MLSFFNTKAKLLAGICTCSMQDRPNFEHNFSMFYLFPNSEAPIRNKRILVASLVVKILDVSIFGVEEVNLPLVFP